MCLPGAGTFRHALALGLSLNLTRDGGYSEPVYAAEQFSVMPAYLLYGDFGYDVLAFAHVGVPIALTGVSSVGAELGATIGYRLLARFGIFTQLSFDAFLGTGGTLNPTLALEVASSSTTRSCHDAAHADLATRRVLGARAADVVGAVAGSRRLVRR